jgi:hypothetical protein
VNEGLRSDLIEMERHDRALRAELVERGELHSRGYHPEMEKLHREHNARIKEIVEVHGWPGRSLVGEDGCRAAGFIVQHAILDPDLQEHCVDLLKSAVADGEAEPFMLALLTDRVLVQKGESQLYGTQYVGSAGGGVEPWPIADPDSVDERRLSVGLMPLGENTARLNAQHSKEIERAKNG